MKHILVIDKPFKLESGSTLSQIEISYHTYGDPNSDMTNTIWICHALTGNSNAADWWNGLVGEGKLFDPTRYFIICANILGSCYGSSGPLSINPLTYQPYYRSFPMITVRDWVNGMILLRKSLGLKKIRLCIGGSIGGQQVLEWAIMEPNVIETIVPISSSARQSPWGIAFNEAQRMAIEADPTWQNNDPEPGENGLIAARATAMLSYRNYKIFHSKQLDFEEKLDDFRASSYLQHQGSKLAQRFNAQSYWLLTKAMDSHNVGRDRGTITRVLQTIKAHALIIGVSSDILFPVIEQRFLAKHIPDAIYREISSDYGHDGFLVEYTQLSAILKDFLP